MPQQRHHSARLDHAVDDRLAKRERAFQIEIEIVRAQQRAVVQNERDFHQLQPVARGGVPHAKGIRSPRAKADVAIRAERGIHLQARLFQQRRRLRRIEMQIVLPARDHRLADGLFHILLLLGQHLVTQWRQVAPVEPDVPPAPVQVAGDLAHGTRLVAISRPVIPAIDVVDDVPLADPRREKEERRAEAEPLLRLDPRREDVELPRRFAQTHRAGQMLELLPGTRRVAKIQRDGPRQFVAAVDLHHVHIVAQASRKALPLRPRDPLAPLRKCGVQHLVRHRPVKRSIPAPRAVLRLEIADAVPRSSGFLGALQNMQDGVGLRHGPIG